MPTRVRGRATTVRAPSSRTADGPLSKMQLWEKGRRKLGYGDWTPDHPDPYQKYAGMEAHKLYLTMNKRRATQADFLLCVDYCHRHHIRIENATWVFKHYPDAKAEQREHQQLAVDIGHIIESAIGYERTLALGDSAEWVSKLTRAQGKFREEVLHEWEQSRNVTAANL